MVPISQYYLDKEPPNAKAVRDMMTRRPSAAARQSSAGNEQRVTPEGAAVVPTESTNEDAPPPPASKDSPPVSHTETRQGEIEPEPHPQVDGVEGPITTTIAEPSSELSASSSTDEKLDEISLGGDGDQEEIDLS